MSDSTDRLPFRKTLLTLRAALHARLIDDWRRAWTFWSIRLQALALALAAWMIAMPDAALDLWLALPGEAKALLPRHAAQWMPVIIGIAAIGARIARQKGPRDHG